jgi:glycosyltransferase involved in cell wall biosynthesis
MKGCTLIKPRVSVLMAARNAEKKLGDAVQSILGQTFREYELIIVDDGSNDDTSRILSELGLQEDRLLFFRNGRPMGLAHCLNRIPGANGCGRYLTAK